jgi:hypothetical protein
VKRADSPNMKEPLECPVGSLGAVSGSHSAASVGLRQRTFGKPQSNSSGSPLAPCAILRRSFRSAFHNGSMERRGSVHKFASTSAPRGAGCSPLLLLSFLFSVGKWRRLFWLRNRFVRATYARFLGDFRPPQ